MANKTIGNLPVGSSLTGAEMLEMEQVGNSRKTTAGLFGILSLAALWTKPQRSAITALTSGSTIAITLANSNDFSLILAHNATLANPTDIAAHVGQKGSITGAQDGTGSRTLAVGSFWFPIGAAAIPDVPSGANDKFRIDYNVVSATRIDFAVASVGV